MGPKEEEAMKCNRLGCKSEKVLHAQVPVLEGFAYADAYFCQEHYNEGIRALIEIDEKIAEEKNQA
jgi:hypothetical protein